MDKQEFKETVNEIVDLAERTGYERIVVYGGEWDDVSRANFKKVIYNKGFRIAEQGKMWIVCY